MPYQLGMVPIAEVILVFAPHPDDEVFGCGGAILRHVAADVPVHVVIVSDGAYGAEGEKRPQIIAQRQAESRNAAVLLGYGEPEFWGLPDRGVHYGEALIQRMVVKIQAAGADLVYAPSLLEMHPDHRALAMCAIEAARRSQSRPVLALYEIGVPLSPNLLIDITELAERKMMAMQCFVSQNEKQRYDLDIAALNRYRTYTLPAEVTAAEAYVVLSAEDLANDPFRLYQSEHKRQRELGLALDVEDVPLVSVIIRSMDRPTLSEALDSVALQTYSNIEVLVVNAKGVGHSELGSWCGNFPLILEHSPDGCSLSRPKAANLGLENAKGNWLIFLDDDDLFDPDHIAGLIQALHQNPQIMAAYAGVRVEVEAGQVTTLFNSSYDQRKLFATNFIPIHALLFSRSLVVAGGARFDENMEIYEDWDFWLQLASQTDLLHVDNISAVYRAAQGNSGLSLAVNKNLQQQGRERVYDKWRLLWTGADVNGLTQYLFEQGMPGQDLLIKGLQQTINDQVNHIHSVEAVMLERGQHIVNLENHIHSVEAVIVNLENHIHAVEGELMKFKRSFYGKFIFSWSRLTCFWKKKSLP